MTLREAKHIWKRICILSSQYRQTSTNGLRITNSLLSPLPTIFGGELRARAYGLLGVRVGRGAVFLGTVSMIGPQPGLYRRLTVGEGAMVGYGVVFALDDQITVGKYASVSHFVRVYTATHPIGPGSARRLDHVISKPVVIGAGSWIGVGTTILPGVTIGRGAVIAPGAVVVGDIPPNSYAEGNPARVTRELPWGER